MNMTTIGIRRRVWLPGALVLVLSVAGAARAQCHGGGYVMGGYYPSYTAMSYPTSYTQPASGYTYAPGAPGTGGYYGSGAYGAQANVGDPSRQYYTPWVWDGSRYISNYYYKANPTDTKYRMQICVSLPSKPGKVYFWNPTEKKYWGQCDLNPGGGYSDVKEGVEITKLVEAKDESWTQPKPKMPRIPGARDNVEIRLPTPPRVM
jgi:hypothetical protein